MLIYYVRTIKVYIRDFIFKGTNRPIEANYVVSHMVTSVPGAISPTRDSNSDSLQLRSERLVRKPKQSPIK